MEEDQECTEMMNKSGDAVKLNLLTSAQKSDILYGVDDSPGILLSAILGFQQFFTLFGGSVVLPFILASAMCFDTKPLVIAEVMNTLFFVYGISTLLQTSLGVRLPIVQGGSFSFIGPTTAILNLPIYRCSRAIDIATPQNVSVSTHSWNNSFLVNASVTQSQITGPVEDDWKIRMNLICGSLMVASLFQMLVGFTGIVGILLRFIGPLTTSSIISLVGLHLYPIAAEKAGVNWIISTMTVLLVLIFTLYLSDVPIPIPWYACKKGYRTIWFKMFKLFPLILAVILSWGICGILTAADVFPNDPKDSGYKARTDVYIGVVLEAKWIRVPYPGQWGMPTVSVAAVVGTLAGIMSSIFESIGDYYACARISGAPVPPRHAINRGIGMEGIACLLSGALGAGNGITSYSENIAAIGITKVASRRVIQCVGVIMMISGIIGKFGAIFTTIPTPVIGGVFLVLFGLITAVGIANLQFVNMGSSRNLTIFGTAVLAGLGIPYWIKKRASMINTGSSDVDQILTVLLTTEIAVGGLIACILDNTAPGTLQDRGMFTFEEIGEKTSELHKNNRTYHLPSPIQKVLTAAWISKYVPFLPHMEPKDKSEC